MNNRNIRNNVSRTLPLIATAVCLLLAAALVNTCADAPGKMMGGTGSLTDRVTGGLKAVLGPNVSVSSTGVVAFPKEVMQLVLEDHPVQVTTRYDSTGWLGIGHSYLVLCGNYRAKVGIDLSEGRGRLKGEKLLLRLPPCEILAVETVRISRKAEALSWWNPLEPCEVECAYQANRGEAMERLDDPAVLAGAEKRLERRLAEALWPMGLVVEVERAEMAVR